MSCKLFLYLRVEREGRLPPILRLRVRLGWVLCQIAPWHCFGEAITSLIGYYKVARKPGSSSPKTVPQCNSAQTDPVLKRGLKMANRSVGLNEHAHKQKY